MPPDVHWYNVLMHCGILAWNKTLFVHSSNPEPQTSGALIQVRYSSTHFVSSINDDVVTTVAVAVFVAFVNAAATVGIRRPDAVTLATLPVGITPGRAVTASATDVRPNMNNRLNVCFSNDDIPNLLLMFYLFYFNIILWA